MVHHRTNARPCPPPFKLAGRVRCFTLMVTGTLPSRLNRQVSHPMKANQMGRALHGVSTICFARPWPQAADSIIPCLNADELAFPAQYAFRAPEPGTRQGRGICSSYKARQRIRMAAVGQSPVQIEISPSSRRRAWGYARPRHWGREFRQIQEDVCPPVRSKLWMHRTPTMA